MTETLLSVRGDARLDVPPDLATMYCAVHVSENSKAAALQVASGVLDDVVHALRELGGVAEQAGDRRRPLAWGARSVHTQIEMTWPNKEEREVPTGRVLADVDLRIEIRDFALLETVGTALASHEQLQVNTVQWSVDVDNAAWPQVRADAIHAAIAKARDYAAALGGSLTRIEHVADVGLLGGEATTRFELQSHAMSLDGGRRSAHGDSPELDPVPQELVAVIDARFVASVAPVA